MTCKHTFISQDNANAILYKIALTVFGVLGSKVHGAVRTDRPSMADLKLSPR